MQQTSTSRGLFPILRGGVAVLVLAMLLLGSVACAASPTPIAGHPRVRIEMEEGGIMVLELYPEYAPETVANFLTLAESGFYDGTTFHRIVKGFMVQGGDPKGDGTGSSDKTIKGEFSTNGYSKNTLLHTKGVISMARSQNKDSASCQFFIMDGTKTSLDGKYAAFGKLVEGVETLDLLADKAVRVNPMSGEESQPVEKIVIKSISVLGTATTTP